MALCPPTVFMKELLLYQHLICVIPLQGRMRCLESNTKETTHSRAHTHTCKHITADAFLILPAGELQSKTGIWPGGSIWQTSCSLLFVSMSHTHTQGHRETPSLSPLRETHSQKQACHTKTQQPLSSSLFCCFDECSDVFPTAPSEVSSPHTHILA